MGSPASFQAILFDLDGTLVDSREDLARAVNHALRAAGQPEQAQNEIIPHVGNGMRVLLSEVFGPVTDEVLASGISAFAAYYRDHCLDRTKLYDGVAASIPALAKKARLAVVTNKPLGFTETILGGLGIRGHFSAIIGGDSLPERKPHPAPVLKALDDVGVGPEAALLVGDGVQDIMAGQAAGAQTCIARYGFGFNPDSLGLNPDFSINSFKEIKEIVL